MILLSANVGNVSFISKRIKKAIDYIQPLDELDFKNNS